MGGVWVVGGHGLAIVMTVEGCSRLGLNGLYHENCYR